MPEFKDPAQVIYIVRSLPNFHDFYRSVGAFYCREFHAWIYPDDYMDDKTGLLASKAIEFFKEAKP